MNERRLGAIVLFGLLSACGTSSDVEDLKSYFEERTPTSTKAQELESLNEAFARQSVRAHGYRESSATESTDDAWSPIVRAGTVAGPEDVSEWVKRGTIDVQGKFAPDTSSGNCETGVSAKVDPLPDGREIADGEDARVQNVVAALAVVSPGLTEVRWQRKTQYGIQFAQDGRVAIVNPRLLQLVPVRAGTLVVGGSAGGTGATLGKTSSPLTAAEGGAGPGSVQPAGQSTTTDTTTSPFQWKGCCGCGCGPCSQSGEAPPVAGAFSLMVPGLLALVLAGRRRGRH